MAGFEVVGKPEAGPTTTFGLVPLLPQVGGEVRGLYCERAPMSRAGRAILTTTDGPEYLMKLDLDADGMPDATVSPKLRSSNGHSIAIRGDTDRDGEVDKDDPALIATARNQPAPGPDDPRDLEKDGKMTMLDARILVTLFAHPGGASQ